MKIWIVKTSEMLETDSSGGRTLRSGTIAKMCAEKGHEVTWWMSTFDHANRRQRYTEDTATNWINGGRIMQIYSPGYRKVVSLQRVWDHWYWSRKFSSKIDLQEKPDIIFCAYPTIEAAVVCCKYGALHGVPVVLDLRDMWPDIFKYALPSKIRKIADLALSPMYRSARFAMSTATAIFGITDEFLEWGLTYAGRPKRACDKAYPLAYSKSNFEAKHTHSSDSKPGILALENKDEDFVISLVGSLNGNRYEMKSLLDAFTILQQRGSKARLIIAGDGENLEAYRTQAKDLQNVTFLGWLGNEQIGSLLRISDLGVVPYRNTPDFMMSVPNKAVEYLANSVPILTCLNGTLKRVISENDCGFSYSAENPEQLATLILSLSNDKPSVAAKREKARALYENSFIAENVYSDLINHLEKIAEFSASSGKVGQGQIKTSDSLLTTSS